MFSNERLRNLNGWRLFLLLPMLWLSISTAGPHSHDFVSARGVSLHRTSGDASDQAESTLSSHAPSPAEHCFACDWAAAVGVATKPISLAAPVPQMVARVAARYSLVGCARFAAASRGPPPVVFD